MSRDVFSEDSGEDGAGDADEGSALMASLAAAEQNLSQEGSQENHSSLDSFDSEERDKALLQQQIAEGDAIATDHTGSSGSAERTRKTTRASIKDRLKERSTTNSSSGWQQLIQGIQVSVEKDGASTGGSASHVRQEELWRLVQQQRKEMLALEQEMEQRDAKQSAEMFEMMHQLHLAQERKNFIQDTLERVQAEICCSQELAVDFANDLKGELADAKDTRLSSDTTMCDLDDVIAGNSAKTAEQVRRMERSVEAMIEANEERNKERVMVDASQRRIQEAQIQDLRKELQKTQASVSQVKEERDRLRDRAAILARNRERVPLLQQEVAHMKYLLEEKLDRAGDSNIMCKVVPHTQGFKDLVEEMKEAQRKEVETKKFMVDLEEQVKGITRDKDAAVDELETDDFDSDWHWMEVVNAFSSGHDTEGSGQAYTLEEAKRRAQILHAVGFTLDRFLDHPEGTDGIFWFHSKVSEDSKLPRDTGRPDGMQSLFFRSEALIPKVRMWFDGQKTPVAALGSQSSGVGASSLGAISEDGDNFSDLGSVGVNAGNASSVGDIDDIADIHDFDDSLYGFHPARAEARLAEQAELVRELQEQLADERALKDVAADELAAYVGAKESTLARLRERVVENEAWRARAQQKVVDAQDGVDNRARAEEQRGEDERARVALRDEDNSTKDRRVAELKHSLSTLKNQFDDSQPEWSELRSLIALAKAGKQVADMRVVDLKASATAMESAHSEAVAKLSASIAALQDPGAAASAQAGDGGAAASGAQDHDSAAAAEVRQRLADVRREISGLAAMLGSWEGEHREAKRALQAGLSAQADEYGAAHGSDVRELQATLGATVKALRLSLAEPISGS